MTEEIKINNLPFQLRRRKLGEKLAQICRDNDIVFMALFGSFAKGQQKKKSDIDIVIRFKKGKRKTLFDLLEIEKELRKMFGKKVDLLTINSVSPYLKKEILETQRVVYEKR